MFDREPSNSELVSWRNKLKAEGAKKLSRQKMIVQVAVSRQAITKYREAFNTYTKSAPAVAVVQNAANDQRDRFDAMLRDYQQPAKKDMERAAELVTKAQTQLDAATTTASKKVPTEDDLKAIAKNQAAVEGYYTSSKSYANDAAEKSATASRLKARAQELADFATDIKTHSVYGMSKISARYTAIKNYASSASSKPKLIKEKINAIASKYKSAKSKYDAEQKRVADAAAAARKKQEAISEKKAQDAMKALKKNWANMAEADRRAACSKFNKSAFIKQVPRDGGENGLEYLNQYRDYTYSSNCANDPIGSRTLGPAYEIPLNATPHYPIFNP